ncbi:MAG: hypothetical protein ABJA78_07825 [Ferruginibacter sp.]
MKKYLLILFTCLSFIAAAQTENDIRKHYQDVNKRIEESKEHGMEGPLYCNEWTSNKNMKSWPALGVYQETTSFWYDDDPNHISSKERDPKVVLLKVIVSRRTASLLTSEEYLYKNGKLVFFFSTEAEEGKQRETRMWFNAKGIFKSTVKADDKELTAKDLATAEYEDFKPRTAEAIKYGKKYQVLFLKSLLDE